MYEFLVALHNGKRIVTFTKVFANNEVQALQLALAKMGMIHWATETGYKIGITNIGTNATKDTVQGA